MLKRLVQAVQGCRNLPHTGPHPGRHVMLLFGMVMVTAGAQRGVGPMVGCLAAYVLLFGPVYLMGGHARFHLNEAAKAKQMAPGE